MTEHTLAELFLYMESVIDAENLETDVKAIEYIVEQNDFTGQVDEFHKTFIVDADKGYTIPTLKHRLNLMFEELSEIAMAGGCEVVEHYEKLLERKLKESRRNYDNNKNSTMTPIEVLDGLCDLQYVLSGTIVEIGIPHFDEAFRAVHVNNMDKFHASYPDAQRVANRKLVNFPEGSRVEIIPYTDNKTGEVKYILKINNKIIKPDNHTKVDLTPFLNA